MVTKLAWDETDDTLDEINLSDLDLTIDLARKLLKLLRTQQPTRQEAKFLISAYLKIQDMRTRWGAMAKTNSGGGVMGDILVWLHHNMQQFEGSIQTILKSYAQGSRPGRWLLSQTGIGPVIAAGVLAYIDPEIAKAAGNTWSYAGLAPNKVWLPGHRRPWNVKFQRIAYYAGESFTKNRKRDSCYYGHIYWDRKQREIIANMRGEYKDAADEGGKRVGKETQAYAWYTGSFNRDDQIKVFSMIAEGRSSEQINKVVEMERQPEGTGVCMLPPGHIDRRAKRIAIKMFLSHAQYVIHDDYYGFPPEKPYVFREVDHTHFIPPPGWPCQ